MSATPGKPWEDAGSFDLPDDPSDQELRRALRVVAMGGAVGGSAFWCVACVRNVQRLGPADARDRAAVDAYGRVERIMRELAPPPTGVLAKAGRGLVDVSRPLPLDDAPPEASDDEIRRIYGPFDGARIINFRRELEQLSDGT